jgi:three-Cys-motif partner protein
MANPRFGGAWTQSKLSILRDYLRAYLVILKKHSYFETVYVDAFAGAGAIELPKDERDRHNLFDDVSIPEATEYVDGSVKMALGLYPPFDRYLLIEKDAERCMQLKQLKSEFPNIAGAVEVVNADANNELTEWCRRTDWLHTRAVVFLDPFGMDVEWDLLRRIADTQAIDMWLWFPISAINRHLIRRDVPTGDWAKRLTRALGTEGWRAEFYPETVETNLFGDETRQVKETDYARLSAFILRRLQELFGDGVSPNAKLFRNSKQTPMYLFCFATAARTQSSRAAALRIANHVLRKY